ncbi:sensor histidine kinase [Streptomyces ziwulingensis]|uniref:histidine kinase n=1 Tax=Streptomyces ziwulingensis TaxID=1045501 RepID=A0ABP9BQN2_9ACTN
MTAPARSGDRTAPRTFAAVTLPCSVVCALAVGGAVAAAPSSVRLSLGLGASAAALVLCAAVTAAVHGLRSARLLRRRLDAATAETGRLGQEQVRLTEALRREQQRLRGEAAGEQARLAAESERERARLLAGFERERTLLLEESARERDASVAAWERERERLLEQRAEEVTRLGAETARLRARLDRAAGERKAALSATGNAAGRMQALATGMLADLRAMEERHSGEDVLADLLHLDHRTAQAGRLADSVAVLAGARSGRRWARPIGMESILRGAMGRIAGYQRVRVHSTSAAAVAGHAAEGVMHALAELLDNAANFSPPTAEVHVYVEQVPAGVIVSVEDSGLVMGDVQLRRAQQAVAGETSGLGGLAGTRLGLAVVGRLSRKYGLKVSFRPSARGGTGVLMLIPQDLLTGAGTETPVPTGGAALPGDFPPVPSGVPAVPAGGPAQEPPATATGPARERTGTAGTYPQNPTGGTGTPPEHTHAPAGSPSEQATGSDPGRPRHPGGHGGGEPPAELPKRRRGRTLAAAEHARSAERDTGDRPAPSAEDTRARTARFGSFREAVRATPRDTGAAAPAPAPAAVPAPATDHPSPSSSHAHPEGDTTS